MMAYPELRLMGLIVIAIKLSQPFDDIPRVPETEAHPMIVRVDWSKWQKIMIDGPSKGLRPSEAIHVTDKDILNLSGKKMDDYLDWYQRTFVDDRDPKRM